MPIGRSCSSAGPLIWKKISSPFAQLVHLQIHPLPSPAQRSSLKRCFGTPPNNSGKKVSLSITQIPKLSGNDTANQRYNYPKIRVSVFILPSPHSTSFKIPHLLKTNDFPGPRECAIKHTFPCVNASGKRSGALTPGPSANLTPNYSRSIYSGLRHLSEITPIHPCESIYLSPKPLLIYEIVNWTLAHAFRLSFLKETCCRCRHRHETPHTPH
jgi:hypothetical protein